MATDNNDIKITIQIAQANCDPTIHQQQKDHIILLNQRTHKWEIPSHQPSPHSSTRASKQLSFQLSTATSKLAKLED